MQRRRSDDEEAFVVAQHQRPSIRAHQLDCDTDGAHRARWGTGERRTSSTLAADSMMYGRIGDDRDEDLDLKRDPVEPPGEAGLGSGAGVQRG